MKFAKITQSSKWYIVELENSKLHILNKKALKWNLVHVFKVPKSEVPEILTKLEISGTIELEGVKVA